MSIEFLLAAICVHLFWIFRTGFACIRDRSLHFDAPYVLPERERISSAALMDFFSGPSQADWQLKE
jgi:hypothetical protein